MGRLSDCTMVIRKTYSKFLYFSTSSLLTYFEPDVFVKRLHATGRNSDEMKRTTRMESSNNFFPLFSIFVFQMSVVVLVGLKVVLNLYSML